MKTLLTILLAAGAIHGTPALAQSPAQSSAAKTSASSPLLGSWAVDTSRLPIPPEARPKTVTITFSDAGNGKWTVSVDIVDAEGAKINSYGTYPLDGTAASGHGSTIEADTGAIKLPAPNVLVMGLGKGDLPASTRVYTVAADGKSMIETAVSFDNVPVMRTHYFTRIR